MTEPLRIAFLTNKDCQLPAWEAEMLQQLMKKEYAVLVTFITGETKILPSKGFMLRFFEKFENRWFRYVPDAFKNTGCKKDYSNVNTIDIADQSQIKSLNLDVVYCSCLADEKQAAATLAKYGIWRISIGAGKYAAKIPWAFQEVKDDCPEIGSSLTIRKGAEKDEMIVYKGTTTTVPYSVKNTLNCLAWKSSSFFAYRLKELWETGSDQFFNFYKNKYRYEQAPELSRYPSGPSVLKFWLVNIFRYLRYKIRLKLFEGKFTILYSFQRFALNGVDYKKFRPLKLPPATFWADVFLVEGNEKRYLFFEEYLYSKKKAHISAVEINDDGSVTPPVIVLDKSYHLSYPFVFMHEGRYYMIPETSGNNTVELYSCKLFPYEWEHKMTLINDLPLMDATVIHHNGKWWMLDVCPNMILPPRMTSFFFITAITFFQTIGSRIRKTQSSRKYPIAGLQAVFLR